MQSELGTENEPQIDPPPAEAPGGGQEPPDPDFPIEGSGGPMDGGGQVQTGNPPPH